MREVADQLEGKTYRSRLMVDAMRRVADAFEKRVKES